MPILLIDYLRALWALRRDRGFVALGILLLSAIAGGGVFYWAVEDLRLLDALYLSVITLTTVGYGDFAPATDAGKIFTATFVIIGMGILVAFISTIAAHIRRNSVVHGPLARLAAHRNARRPRSETRREVHAVGSLSEVGDYDLLLIGSDEGSRRTAVEAAQAGLRVVIVESSDQLPARPGAVRDAEAA